MNHSGATAYETINSNDLEIQSNSSPNAKYCLLEWLNTRIAVDINYVESVLYSQEINNNSFSDTVSITYYCLDAQLNPISEIDKALKRILILCWSEQRIGIYSNRISFSQNVNNTKFKPLPVALQCHNTPIIGYYLENNVNYYVIDPIKFHLFYNSSFQPNEPKNLQ